MNYIWELSKVTGKTLPSKSLRLRQVRKTGSWIYVHLFTINIMELGRKKWSDALLIHYRVKTQDITLWWNGWGGTFSIPNKIDLKMAYLSWLDTTSYVAGYLTWISRTYCPFMCRMYPSSTPVASYRVWRTIHILTYMVCTLTQNPAKNHRWFGREGKTSHPEHL